MQNVSIYLLRTWCLYTWSCLDILITMHFSINCSRVICSPTVTRDSLIFSTPSIQPWFFRHGRPEECHAAASSARPGRKAHFLSWFFIIEVGAHHIYDDTGFCHNYHHRSVICMTEKNSFSPKCHGCVFFCSVVLWSFQVLGKDSMDYGIRSGKSLSLGMPKAPQGNIQGQPRV